MSKLYKERVAGWGSIFKKCAVCGNEYQLQRKMSKCKCGGGLDVEMI